MAKQELLEIQPLQNLKFRHLWALGVGAVIGDGIFLLIGEGIAVAGPSAILAYIVAGLFQFFLMISLAELAIGMPSAGGMTAWVERFMGKWWGFLSGFAFAAGWVIAGGGVSMALGTITSWYFPHLSGELWTTIFAIVFVTVFALLNILGTAIAAKTQLYLVLILTAGMSLFALVGIKDINTSNFSNWFPHGTSGFLSAIPMGTYAYLGALSIITAGAETVNKKDLPRALIWSSITFIIIYSAAQFVLQGIIPWQDVTMDSSPFTEAANVVFGYAGAFIINFIAWIAAATCIIMGTFYTASRIFYSQARKGYLPKFFGYLHPKTRTPVYGIISIWVISVLFILIGAFNPNLIYVEFSLQLTLSWIVSWSLAVIAAILYRKHAKEEVMSLPWKQWA
ncbi:APC family permease [Virgibacillus kimchii]